MPARSDEASHDGKTTEVLSSSSSFSISNKKNSNDDTSSWLDVCVAEEMNPSRRCNMEDCSVVHLPGTWNAADPDMAYLGVYDGT